MRFKLAFLAILTLLSISFAGGPAGTVCAGASDTFLTCNPANTALLPAIGSFADSNSWSVRVGNGDYRKASAYAYKQYLSSQLTIKDTTFVDTARGFTTKPVITVSCSKNGSWTTCQVPAVTGTSNTTALTLDAFPSGWRPAAATRLGGLAVTDTNVVNSGGFVTLGTDGVATFGHSNTAGVPNTTFTGSSTKAFAAFVIQFLR